MRMSRRVFLAATCALAARAAVAAEIQDTWEGVGRVVAIGDVHGDKDAFVAVLKMAGMIDAQERWIGGGEDRRMADGEVLDADPRSDLVVDDAIGDGGEDAEKTDCGKAHGRCRV